MRKGIIVNIDLCVGCQACYVACKQENQVAPNIQWNQIQREENESKGIINYFRMSCMHCDEPACMPVCPVKAISRGPKGEVLVDDAKCIGCHACEKACPWHVPMFNASGKTSYWDKPALVEIPPAAHQKRIAGKAEHCTLCTHRDTPACVEACKLGALTLIDYDSPSADQKAMIEASRAMNGADATRPKVRYICTSDDVTKWKKSSVHLQ